MSSNDNAKRKETIVLPPIVAIAPGQSAPADPPTGTTWRIQLDDLDAPHRHGEARNIAATSKAILDEYERVPYIPRIEVVVTGVGEAVALTLEAHKIPVTRIKGLSRRIDGGNILITQSVFPAR